MEGGRRGLPVGIPLPEVPVKQSGCSSLKQPRLGDRWHLGARTARGRGRWNPPRCGAQRAGAGTREAGDVPRRAAASVHLAIRWSQLLPPAAGGKFGSGMTGLRMFSFSLSLILCEVSFPYYTIHPFKVYSSVASGTFTDMGTQPRVYHFERESCTLQPSAPTHGPSRSLNDP